MIAGLIFRLLSSLALPFADRILTHAERKADSTTAREQIAAEIVKGRLAAQRDVLVAGSRWLQWLYAVPLGIWFSAVIADSLFHFSWNVAALPSPLNDWAAAIIGALFLADVAPKVAAQLRSRPP